MKAATGLVQVDKLGIWLTIFPIWKFELSLSLTSRSLLINKRPLSNFILFPGNRDGITSFLRQDENWNLATCSSKLNIRVTYG